MPLQTNLRKTIVSLDKNEVPAPLVLVDADNTLWDTDGVFADAQLKLLNAVEEATGLLGPEADRLSFVRAFDQEIAKQHHQGLRYPPRLLIDALVFGLHGAPVSQAVRQAWRQGEQSGLDRALVARVEQEFFEAIGKQPALLDGVETGLRMLSFAGVAVIILTEGSRKRVARSLEFHQLAGFVDRVFEAPKNRRMFGRIKALATADQMTFVVGDQLTRDIQPANDAGLETIFVPGRFQPLWERETGIRPSFQAPSFDAAAAYILHFIAPQRAGTAVAAKRP